ncbi:uncharacterized protein V1478_016917 [Vespula squamosa]|uniref:Uncharacterized protein n=1 Tax=Vespula squamosa TaxID=30214 RepID=A0ABD1ZXW9_VESSQ
MECSDIEDDELYQHEESELEKNQNIRIMIMILQAKRRARVFSSSKDENEKIQYYQIEIATIGISWEKIKKVSSAEKLSLHNIFKEIFCPIRYTNKNIMKN